MEDVTANVFFEQCTSRRGFIDVTIADAKTIIEQRSFGVGLDKVRTMFGKSNLEKPLKFGYITTKASECTVGESYTAEQLASLLSEDGIGKFDSG